MVHNRKRKHNQEPSIPAEQIKQEDIKIENENSQNDESIGTAESNQQSINRRARIIVRNLSFKSTEAKLKKHFEQYGPIIEVKLLKRPDGKLVGCGFVQYEIVQNAAKAILQSTGKPFLGRDIVCDWALGKSTYVRNMREAIRTEVKNEKQDESADVIEIKEETKANDETNETEEEKHDPDVKTEESSSDESDKVETEEENDDEDEVFSDENESQTFDEPEIKRPKVISNDVQEGKTIFIKNVPFQATNNDIKQCMEQFGPLHYGLICMDSLTEHSKGTAFVKFQDQDDAQTCLQAGTELTLMGNILDCHLAVSKNELNSKKDNKDVKKDSRNLYLIKEGVILAGSKAAQGLSATDMQKRLELERWKTQILRNLNMFISRYRLIIHNLPPSYDDKEVKELFARYAGQDALIKEARVMKDLRNFNDEGKPSSKGYGFVSFSKHEDALKALRAINNNPSVFTRAKRPIVAFSIENKAVINARTKRLEKSKLHNPTCKEFDPKAGKPNPETKPKSRTTPRNPKNNEKTGPEFSGIAAKPGQVNKMRSKYKLSNQAQIHQESLKKEKTKLKLTRKVLKKKKQEHMKQTKQTKQKKNKGKNKGSEDNFSKLVNNYTQSGSKSSKAKKRKWYEK